MSFWDHLEELRGVLFRSVLALLGFTVLGLIFKNFLFDEIILAPTKSDFVIYSLLGWAFSIDLINVDLSAQFFTHLKASVAVGFVLAFPFMIWEVWKFVLPALYNNEKKALRVVFLMASVLFYVGVAVGYFLVLPVCLRFFMTYTVSADVLNSITLSSYMSMFSSMVLLIGLVFEFPSIVFALSRLGIVSRELLRKGRRYAFVIILIISAFITPADPVSMFVLAVPLYLLYELSIFLCKSSESR